MTPHAVDVLLLLNGDITSTARLKQLARHAGVVLCADGAARHAAKLGIMPRAVIGDMDSLPKRLPKWKSTIYVCDFDPNTSDFEKALRFIARQRFKRAAKRILGSPPDGGPSVYVAGALGGRLDHEMINWALLEHYSEFLRLSLVDPHVRILGEGRHQIDCAKGQTVSLLAVTPKAVVTTHGLAYPLRRGLLERSSRGLSNRAVLRGPSVKIHSGRVWVIPS